MYRTLAVAAVAMLAVGAAGSASAQGLTESQARAVLSNKCGNIGELSRDSAGGWHGTCDAGQMMVDPSGQTMAENNKASFGGLSEGQALAVMNNACSNVSELSQDSQGNWHGSCSSGPMVVTSKGQVMADKGGAGMTEDNVRAIANGACGSVSDLSVDAAGQWSGVCDKGRFSVDSKGAIRFN